jgi:hypothetical protein
MTQRTLRLENTAIYITGTKQVKSSPNGSKNKIKESLNQLLEIESIAHVTEKLGWHWALTRFAVDTWGQTEKTQIRP